MLPGSAKGFYVCWLDPFHCACKSGNRSALIAFWMILRAWFTCCQVGTLGPTVRAGCAPRSKTCGITIDRMWLRTSRACWRAGASIDMRSRACLLQDEQVYTALLFELDRQSLKERHLWWCFHRKELYLFSRHLLSCSRWYSWFWKSNEMDDCWSLLLPECQRIWGNSHSSVPVFLL